MLAPLNNLFLQDNSYCYITEAVPFQRKLRKYYFVERNLLRKKKNNARKCFLEKKSCNEVD